MDPVIALRQIAYYRDRKRDDDSKFADNTVRYEAAMRYLSAQIKTMLTAIQG